MSKFKIGLIVDSLRMDVISGIKLAGSLGVEGIQIHSTGEMARETLTDEKRSEVLKIIKECGMTISAVTGNLGGHSLSHPEDYPVKIPLAKSKVDLAVSLGCPIVATHVGVIPSDKECDRYKRMQEALTEIGTYADQAGVKFAIETGPEKTSVLKDFILSLPCSGIAVNYDPANLLMVTGEDPVEGVYNLKDLIIHTHAKDGVMLKQTDPQIIYDFFAQGGIEDMNLSDYFREEALGRGDVKFDLYLKALSDIGYNSFLTIERELGPDPIADIKLAVDFLRSKID
ncbi:MAG: sugar phosphate isomerase/epimerase family protein [Oscillospiraceae bacterium]